MSAPKPGDRVRVTYEGKLTALRSPERQTLAIVQTTAGGHFLPPEATVEVIASPVYVNHDTTVYRDGDVVRAAGTGESYHRIWGAWRTADGEIFDGFGPQMEPLTLLVRDGQVVQP